MKGAIIGDVLGSPYEFTMKYIGRVADVYMHITDDSVLTAATAYALLNGKTYADCYREFYQLYPDKQYGASFVKWARTGVLAHENGSLANGSAMRVSPIGWAYNTLDEVLKQADLSARETHFHPEGLAGAQAIASAVFLARTGNTKQDIAQYITATFGYDLKDDSFIEQDGICCRTTVPKAIHAFLTTEDYDTAVHKSMSFGLDTDTLAAMTGGIAEAYYGGVPAHHDKLYKDKMPTHLLGIMDEFYQKFGPKS